MGKEICASSATYFTQEHHGVNAETFLWRPCCLISYWKWSLHGEKGHKSLYTEYQTALLKDAGGITILSPARSSSRHQGLIYSQFYNSQKELFDAAKTYPFHDPSLESLALDPHLRKTWQHVGGSQNHNPQTLLANYFAGKARCHNALIKSMNRSFGVREEHRMTLTLAREVRHRLQNLNKWDVQIYDETQPRPYWQLSSKSFLNFLHLNINKFVTGFEYVLSQTDRDFVSWEQTKMMIVFLRMMKFSFGSHRLSAESALWWDRKEWPNGRIREGLAMSQSVSQYGYGWFADKFDWDKFTLKHSIKDLTLFGNIQMAEAYHVRWREIKDIKDDVLIIEHVTGLLADHRHIKENFTLLKRYLIWVCVRHFRKEVFACIKKDIQEEYQTAAMKGDIKLCWWNATTVLKNKPSPHLPPSDFTHVHLINGNKMTFKHLYDLVDYLWDYNDAMKRTHWEHKGYRALYQRVSRVIKVTFGRRACEKWQGDVKKTFILSTWLLPYPNHTVFLQHTKQSLRMWVSVYHPQVDQLRGDEGEEVAWRDVIGLRDDAGWVIGRGADQTLPHIPPDDALVDGMSVEELGERLQEGQEEFERAQARLARRGALGQ